MKKLTTLVLFMLATITDLGAQQPRQPLPPAPPAQRQAPTHGQVTDQDRALHALRELTTLTEVNQLVRSFADAIEAPDHIRWFCLMENSNKMNELRRSQPDHPFFMNSNTGFYANEAGAMILRTRRAYEVSLQQICLANAMRSIRGFPAIHVPPVTPP